MEVVGGVASVLTVAELGAKVSITIFKLVDAWKSAPEGIKALGTDIALLSPVIEDLGKALKRLESKKDVVPTAAINNGLRIARECRAIFEDIETAMQEQLGTSIKSIYNSSDNQKLPKISSMDRLSWLLTRKNKTAVWQGRLANLKASVTIQLGVLNLEEKLHSGPGSETFSDVEMRTLKALLEAKKRTKVDLHTQLEQEQSQVEDPRSFWGPSEEVTAKQAQTQETIPRAGDLGHSDFSLFVAGLPSKSPDVVNQENRVDQETIIEQSSDQSTLRQVGSEFDGGTSLYPSNPGGNGNPEHKLIHERSNESTASSSSHESIEDGIMVPSEAYRNIWGNLDILEHAIQKVDLARWELDRMLQNKQRSAPTDDPLLESDAIATLAQKVDDLGVSQKSRTSILKHLLRRCDHKYGGLRHPVKLALDSEETTLDRHCTDYKSTILHSHSIVKRWIPDPLDDLLFETICKKLDLTATGPPINRSTHRRLMDKLGDDSDDDMGFGEINYISTGGMDDPPSPTPRPRKRDRRDMDKSSDEASSEPGGRASLGKWGGPPSEHPSTPPGDPSPPSEHASAIYGYPVPSSEQAGAIYGHPVPPFEPPRLPSPTSGYSIDADELMGRYEALESSMSGRLRLIRNAVVPSFDSEPVRSEELLDYEKEESTEEDWAENRALELLKNYRFTDE